jgi:hypothetical protein
MAEVKIFYEPETDLLTIFWDTPRKNQICTETDDGIILIKDGISLQPIGVEILSYKPGDKRIEGISLSMGKPSLAA